MLAIDTNLVVRYLTGDHPSQSQKARALIDSEPVFVCKTVLLEVAWVLRSVFAFSDNETAQALVDFAGLPTVNIEDPATVATALAWVASGMDFADAFHLANAQASQAFVTFDRALARKARQFTGVTVRVL